MKVAYDISFIASFFKYPGGQSGVYRTIEELLFELCRRPDVELNTVAVSGDDPLLDVTNSLLYMAAQPQLGCHLDPAIHGRLGLSTLYLRTFGRGASPLAVTENKRLTEKTKQLITRFVRKIDKPHLSFQSGEYDLFHSPFLRLPSHTVIGEIPRILTVYDLIFLKNPEFMTPTLVSYLLRIFDSLDVDRDWVICISEFTKQEFCEYTGMSPQRVFVTPLAAAEHFHPVTDTEQIAAVRRKYGIPDGDYFLTLSALQPRKNFSHVIRCFVRLLSENPGLDINLVLVGAPGWLYEDIFAASQNGSEARRRIIFTGHVANEELSTVYAGAKAFLFPSLYEGFGLPPLEAMQCGVPVVVSNTTALPEVVGDAGLLVNPKDENSLCQAMLDLLRYEDLGLQLSRKGLQRSQKFSWQASAELTVAAYEKALHAENTRGL